MADKKKRRLNDWYSISVDSLRAWTTLGLVAAALVAGAFGFRSWEKSLDKRAAEAAIAAVEGLVAELDQQAGVGSYRAELEDARRTAREARASYDEGDYARALTSARSARSLLEWIEVSLGRRDSFGEARFLTVDGSVQYSRGESGDWEPAADGAALSSGDYVRTGPGGSAEIAFANGTRSVVRPNTMFRVYRTSSPGGSREQAISMQYGWVNMETSERDSSVSTPEAHARVGRDSEAAVSYDRDSGTAHFVSYEGSVEVAAKSGARREVAPLKQVVQVGTELSPPSDLPGEPQLLAPADNFQVNFGKAQQMRLDWSPIRGAVRYALQIAKDSAFTDRVIDAPDRVRTGATLGLRGEGSFEWRVAAVDGDGVQGPWSAARRFRVAALANDAAEGRKLGIQLHSVNSYGNIFMLRGATEPGAELTINGERITVAPDGSFTTTIQVFEEGWSFVTLRAENTRGNTIERRERVFVETF